MLLPPIYEAARDGRQMIKVRLSLTVNALAISVPLVRSLAPIDLRVCSGGSARRVCLVSAVFSLSLVVVFTRLRQLSVRLRAAGR